MISDLDILTSSGRHRDRELMATDSIRHNATETARRISLLETSFGGPFVLSSGYRTPAANRAEGGADNSLHTLGKAGDIIDNQNRDLSLYCTCDPKLLEHFGLWMEHPAWTREWDAVAKVWRFWVHVQIDPPASGNRIFIPSSKPPPRFSWPPIQ